MWNKSLQKCHLFIVYNFTYPFLATLQLRRPESRVARLWIVNNKQMTFLQIFVSQQLLFLFSKHLDTMSNVTNCGTSRTDLWFSFVMEVSIIKKPKIWVFSFEPVSSLICLDFQEQHILFEDHGIVLHQNVIDYCYSNTTFFG